jgi:beta-glucosidase
MLIRRYGVMFRFGLFDHPPEKSEIPAEKNGAVARDIAAAGSVLLRNENNILPLDIENGSIKSIALLGPWAAKAATGGIGSSMVNPVRTFIPADVITKRLQKSGVKLTVDADADPEAAAVIAASADVAVVIAGSLDSESIDRENLSLPDNQDALISAVAAANPHTVVFIHAGGPVLMPWLNDVAAVMDGFYPGGEDGEVTADLLFGDRYPSGRLPITFPASEQDGPANTEKRYPGVDGKVFYDEGLETGYRWYQAQNITPLFPFGFGLSYTAFSVEQLDISSDTINPGDLIDLTVKVTNTGTSTGEEVVQVYVSYPADAGEPPKQLRAFKKVLLEPGKSRTVSLTLGERALAVYDTAKESWVVNSGSYGIYAGTSSFDTPLTSTVKVK